MWRRRGCRGRTRRSTGLSPPTPPAGATGGNGSTNSIHFNGGAGGAAGTGSSAKGGGGGSSGGSASAGGNGAAGNSGGAAGTPPAGAYAGGTGAQNAHYRGQSGQGPGGGGGGGAFTAQGTGGGASTGGLGKGGQVRLTYFVTITPSATVTQVLPRVPVQVTALWSSVTYPLFNGFADSWTETPVTYSAGYSEFTLAATDGFKVLAGNNLAALASPLGAAEDSGSRADRILDWAGWSPSARAIDAGDTNQQATSFGSDALSLLQLTADTEIGETYVNGSGNVVFRHRQAILTDTRSATPQAVFGDLPGTLHASAGLLSYWKWNDASGSTVADSAGANTGTWAGTLGSQWGSGIAGGAGVFNGTNNQADFGTAPNPAAGLTVSMWVNPANVVQVAHATIFGLGGSWWLEGDAAGDNTYQWFVNNGSDHALQLIALTAATWQHVALTWNGSTAITYVNGVSMGSQGVSGSLSAAGANHVLAGNRTGFTRWWQGSLDETTVFSRALTVTEIQALYNGGASAPPAGSTEIAYAAVGRADDDTTLANDIQITAAGSANLQEAIDPVSVYVFQSERSYVRTDLLLPDDATAFQYANWVLFISKDAEDRFDTLTVDPQADTASLWPQVLGREIGDRIQVWRRPSGVAAPVTKDVFIRGIAPRVRPRHRSVADDVDAAVRAEIRRVPHPRQRHQRPARRQRAGLLGGSVASSSLGPGANPDKFGYQQLAGAAERVEAGRPVRYLLNDARQ